MNLDQAEEFFDKLEGSGCLKQPFVIPKRKLEDHVAGDGPAPDEAGQVGEGDSDPKRRRISEAGGEPEEPPARFKDCGPLNSVEDVRGLHVILFIEELPEEILAKFTPVRCDLCSVDLVSPYGKKYHHYNGNPHRKAIAKYMENLGLPRPTRRRPETAAGATAHIAAVVAEANNGGVQLADDDVRALHGNLFCEPLPEEVLSKFLATKCDLCFVDFTSPNGARSHYYGNPHRKSITKFMVNLGMEGPTKKSDLPVPDVLVQLQVDQDIRHCHICNVDLTSEIVAMSHYTGKNHAKKRRAYDAQNAAAAASGVQDQPQQDQAHVPGQVAEVKNGGNKNHLATSFFCMPCQMNFNSSDEYTVHFRSDVHKAKCTANNLARGGTESQIPGSEHGVSEMLSMIRSDPNSPYECTVCHVKTTGEENLKMHLNGKNHKKKLAQLQLGLMQPAAVSVGGAAQQPAVIAAVGGGVQQPAAAVLGGAVQQQAIGDQYPGGPPFRCDYCQITTTDQSTLALHFNGKKHAKRMADLGI